MSILVKYCIALVLTFPISGQVCDGSLIADVIEVAEAHKFEPELIFALAYHESRYKLKALSKKNACGILQVKPYYTRPRVSCEELYDLKTGLRYGVSILHMLKKKTKGNVTQALCAYNKGMSRCKGWYPISYGTDYARYVLNASDAIKHNMKLIDECYPASGRTISQTCYNVNKVVEKFK